MKRHFENLIERATRAIRHWWLLMLAGILSVVLGILVFIFPFGSYITLSILFGVLMLAVGASQLILAATSGNYLMMRGYVIAGGVIDLLIGIFLCVFPAVSMATLPIVMGICFLYHSFMIISLGGDLDTFRLHGGAWITCGGVLLMILSLLILFNPFSIGVGTVIVIAGLALVMFGVMLCTMSVKMKAIHTYMEKEYPRS